MSSNTIFNVYKRHGTSVNKINTYQKVIHLEMDTKNENKISKANDILLDVSQREQDISTISKVVVLSSDEDNNFSNNVKRKRKAKKCFEPNVKMETRSMAIEAAQFSEKIENIPSDIQESEYESTNLQTINNDENITIGGINVNDVSDQNLPNVTKIEDMLLNVNHKNSCTVEEQDEACCSETKQKLMVSKTIIEDNNRNNDNHHSHRKTELEREMELYEAFERDEETRLDIRDQREMLKEPQAIMELLNEKKRSVEGFFYERKKKRLKYEQTLATKTKNEEDVCFICFDGGDLVLCDCRSCPKAYHLGCTGRDEAFFIQKGAWFCGWHFCSNCTKSGNYQCYTCPTAYCSNCVKQSEFSILQKRKGLCDECLPIVSMIEHNETITNDGEQVDFEDKETYEYLFKEYWLELKKLNSIALPIFKNNGVKSKDFDANNLGPLTISDNDESDEDTVISDGYEDYLNDEAHNQIDGDTNESINDSSVKIESIETNNFQIETSLDSKSNDNEDGSLKLLPSNIEGWASRELKAFLKVLKENTSKPLSRFVVHKLLWMYIKQNKLQNPRKMSEIICDEQLRLIFEKDSVGQFEMFKLLNKHFPTKSISKSSSTTMRVDEPKIDDVTTSNTTNQEKLRFGLLKNKKKGRKLEENLQRPKSNEYAAITYKNISLIYLRRSLLEEFLIDSDFESKVVGTFVKIRVPGNSKIDTCYRLVLVTGIGIQKESYMAGTIMTNVTLSILNLQKKESITIEVVSNQDFTEEECTRLRLNIKCGFLKTFTVGQLEEKAISLQEAKINDWIETERQRLINLRDRASEKGRKKELRECVERLQELNNPTFRAEKVKARPEIVADAHMDPGYESDDTEGDSQTDTFCTFARHCPQPRTAWNSYSARPSWGGTCMDDHKHFACYGEKERFRNSKMSSSSREEEISKRVASWNEAYRQVAKPSGAVHDQKVRVEEAKPHWGDEREKLRHLRDRDPRVGAVEDLQRKINDKKDEGMTNPSCPKKDAKMLVEPSKNTLEGTNHTRHHGAVPLTVVPTAPVNLCNVVEQEKVWHYVDPSGTFQGPFSIEQLRKWNGTGLFPIDLRIWKTTEDQKQSILLTDGLQGRFNTEKEQSVVAERSNDKSQAAVLSGPTTQPNTWRIELGSAQESGHGMPSARKQENIKPTSLGQGCQTLDTHVLDHELRFPGKKGNVQERVEALPSCRRPEDAPDASRKDERWEAICIGETSGHGGQSSRSDAARSSRINHTDQEVSVVDGYNVNRDEGQSSTGLAESTIPCRFHMQGYCWKGKACGYWHN